MRQYIIASILIIIALISMVYKASLPTTSLLTPYLSDFNSALLVGGLLSILFKIFQDKESESTLRRLLRIHDSVDDLGLKEIMPEVQAFNFTDIIQNSDSLVVVMNDGLRWVGNNTVALQNRFSKKSITEIFTVDPQSNFVSILAAKTSTTEADLQKKIRDTWARIEDAYNKSTKKGDLIIYSLKTYPTKSIFLTEDQLVETPYQTASGRASIPVFVYRKVARHDSPFCFATNDVSAMRAEANKEKEIKAP